MIQLSNPDRAHLQLLRKINKDKRLYIKVTTLLLLDEGYTFDEIGRILGIDGSTVERYERDFSKFPLEEFLRAKYVGKSPALSQEQLVQLELQLNEYLYLSIAEIRHYVFYTFGVEYKKEGIRDLLKRMGFRYKKTRTVPAKADPIAQEDWVKKFDEDLSQLPDNVEVYFADGVHPMHNTRPEYAWIKKGKDYEMQANSGRQRINLNGAICIQNPDLTFIVESDMISYQSNITLFEKILKARPGKRIIIYADNAKYNHAAVLKEWVSSQNGQLDLRHLPPYSPNLNPIERLWKFMKKEVINSVFYETFQKFRLGILSFFEHILDYSEKLKTLITPKFQVFT
jgi:transposase